ncbi:MAG TPA: hypothetical protein VL986_11475 [Terracidiphilus sp.]|nr:hypothetical protein [Terracidiphilus sp.]
MNKCGILCAAAGFALAVVAIPALNAQRGFGEGPGPGFERGEGFGGFHGQVTTGAPFSATRTITHTQTLADGTTITHTELMKEARDSQGRVFTQELPSPTNQEGHNRQMARIFDPVSHTAITYSPESKQANVLHLPDSSQFQRRRGPAGNGPDAAEEVERFRGNTDMPAPTTESLGSKTINGVVAEGTRTTRVIPAGARGNDKPITITHETWKSTDLKVVVMRVDTDPRDGTTTMELTNISRDEPAASLFQAPAGYTVNERTVGARNPRPGIEPQP